MPSKISFSGPTPETTFTAMPNWASRSTSRSPTSTSTSSGDKHSTSLPWILHHILQRQLSSELPLRIMFSFNAGEKLPTLTQAHDWWYYDTKGKLIIEFLSSLPQITPANDLAADHTQLQQNSDWGKVDDINAVNDPVNQFLDVSKDLLFDFDGPSKPHKSYPLSFVRDLCLDKVFPANYEKALFDRALQALDYLQNMECTRRTVLREAAMKLGIRKDNWRDVLSEDRDAYQWVKKVQKQELEIESYYAQAFVDLRIWTMAHELQSEPFYKPNALAMLNTLFPPSTKDMPNDKIDIKALKKYRATFYRHILAVEANGTGIAKNFVQQLLKPEAKHNWTSVRQSLECYIELAEQMIQQANAVQGEEWYSRRQASTISGATSSFNELRSTVHQVSSANTSLDGQLQYTSGPNSPVIPNTNIITNRPIPSRTKTASKSADTAITFQAYTQYPSSASKSVQPDDTGLQGNRLFNVQNRRTRAAHPTTFDSTIGEPPARAIPALPGSKTDITPSQRRFEDLQLLNTYTYTAFQQTPPDSPANVDTSRNKSYSIPSLKPLTHPRVGMQTQTQMIPGSPLSSAFVPDEVPDFRLPGTPNASSTDLKLQFKFLERPYTELSDIEPPTVKRKTSMQTLFRRKEPDTLGLNPNESTVALLQNDPFPQFDEVEAFMQSGKSSKRNSKSSRKSSDLRKRLDKFAPPSLARETWTSTIKEGQRPFSGSDVHGDAPPLEVDLPRPSLKKTRSATAVIFGNLGKTWKIRKSSRGKADHLKEERTGPYVMAVPEVPPHPPSAPSSPTAKMFATELNLPPRETLRRTKSYEHRLVKLKKSSKTSSSKKSKSAPKNVTGYHNPFQRPPKDYRGLPLDRPITATGLAERVPTTYAFPGDPLPLDPKYDLTRHRDYVRQALIEKARAEKYDTEFEKPRPAPMVPQGRQRGREFRHEALWVPFEMPRATPKTPEQKRRDEDARKMPPPPTPPQAA